MKSIETHVLKVGSVKAAMTIDDSGRIDCYWTPHPSKWSKKKRRAILEHYPPWRNQIVADWSAKHGKSFMIIDPGKSPTATYFFGR